MNPLTTVYIYTSRSRRTITLGCAKFSSDIIQKRVELSAFLPEPFYLFQLYVCASLINRYAFACISKTLSNCQAYSLNKN